MAPAILGMVLRAMLEEHVIRAMIRADGQFLAFFERPIAGALGILVVAVIAIPLAKVLVRSRIRGGGKT